MDNTSGDGGNLELDAGRSILINANITTDNGDLTLLANATGGDGVQDPQRDSGSSVITIADGITLNAGSGTVSFTLSTGHTTNVTSGDISIENIITTSSDIIIVNNGPTAGSDIIRTSSDSLIQSTTGSVSFDVNGAGGSGSIGSSGNRVRLNVSAVDARAQTGGIYLSSPSQAIILGDTSLTGVTGIRSTGVFVIDASGHITQAETVIVTGASTYNNTAPDGLITLNNSANAHTGAVIVTTTDSSGTDAHVVIDNGTTALILDTSGVVGDLTLISGNASGITDTGIVTVGGNLSATTDAGNGVVNMGTLAVDGTIALTTHGTGAATVVNDAGLNFTTSTVGGALSATATTGNIIDNGALAITGTSAFTTSAANATITLDTITNAFTGAVALTTSGSTGHATVDGGTTALAMAASSVGGNLTLKSGHASGITDSGVEPGISGYSRW